MFFLLAGILSGLLLGLTGCYGDSEGDAITAQPYSNVLSALREDTGEVSGRIVFPSEFSQHSIRFSLGGIAFVTHPDGRFRITRVPAGEHILQVHIKGYQPLRQRVGVRAGTAQTLPAFSLAPARGVVRGKLVTPKGVNAGGVQVQLDPNGGVNVTDALGHFQFVGVSAGHYDLRINDTRFAGAMHRVTLRENERHNLGIITVFEKSHPAEPTAQLYPPASKSSVR